MELLAVERLHLMIFRPVFKKLLASKMFTTTIRSHFNKNYLIFAFLVTVRAMVIAVITAITDIMAMRTVQYCPWVLTFAGSGVAAGSAALAAYSATL